MEFSRRAFIGGVAAAIGSGVADAQERVPPEVVAGNVVVVGSGPAGVCAAVAAARNGADVLVVEQGNCLGGMGTQGLVGPFMTCYDKSGEVQIIKGLFDEIVRRMVAIGGAIHPREVRAGTSFAAWHVPGHDHCTPFEPEALKFVLDDLCREAGVKVLYHATFTAPVLEGDRIVGVEVFTKAGPRRILAKMVVDATGDGDVAFRAGVPCELGDPARGGAMQPATMFFRIGNLPEEAVEAVRRQYPKDVLCFKTLLKKAKADGKWHIPRPHINIYRSVKPDEWFVNVSRLNGVNAVDPQSLSDAEEVGRRQVREIMAFFREYVPGAQDVRLLCTASTIGIRESRHVAGEYRLDKDDVISGRVPPDSVFLCSSSIDLHGGKGASGTLYLTIKDGNWYGVPYRCLVPKKVDNLLVAGRCVSASSVAAAAIRVMPPCMAMGEAAGTAAALALKANVAPRALDAAALVSRLRELGVFLG